VTPFYRPSASNIIYFLSWMICVVCFLHQADALTSVNRKIEVTTNTMQENISLLLENDSKLQEIEGKAENMNESAAKFKNSSQDLRKKMWWKMCKVSDAIVCF
jgi:hypothetical protein